MTVTFVTVFSTEPLTKTKDYERRKVRKADKANKQKTSEQICHEEKLFVLGDKKLCSSTCVHGDSTKFPI